MGNVGGVTWGGAQAGRTPNGRRQVADGPSEGTGKGEQNREWAELSHFGLGVKHLVQGWRMFLLNLLSGAE